MYYYILLVVYIIIVSLLLKKRKWLMYVLTFVPLLLFWGTKVDFGPDYDNYLFKFNRQHDMPIYGFLMDTLDGKFEPGFFFLIKIMPSFDGVVFASTLFLLLAILVFFDEYIPKQSFPLALFLWLFNSSIFNTFSAMRSSFVISFFLLAIIAKNKSYYKTAILLTLIGAQFHMSGYFMVLFVLLPYNIFKSYQNTIKPFIFVFIVVALLLPTFFSNLLATVLESNANLSVYEDHVNETDYGFGFYIFSLFRVGFILYILDLLKRNRIEEKYIWIAWLTIICYLFMMMQGIPIMYRVFNYLFLITVAFKCYVLKIDKTFASKVYVGLSIGYALFRFYRYMYSDIASYYELYKSFLFQ